MNTKPHFLRKALAVLLAAIFVFPASVLSAFLAFAEPAGTNTVTAAELVADNYSGLSNEERALLNSGLFDSGSFTYTAPSNDDGLVQIDAANRKITASVYVNGSYTWNPVSAKVVYSGGSEDVALTGGQGSFVYDGNVYSVEVEYAMEIPVPSGLQQRLLNGPYYLAKGLDNLLSIDDYESTFYTLGSNSASLVRLTDGSLPNQLRLSNQNTIDAILRIDAQSKANGGALDLDLMLLEFEAAKDSGNGVKYLLDNGLNFKTVANATYDDIEAICGDEGVNTLFEIVKNTTYGQSMRRAINALNSLLTAIRDAVRDEWGILDTAKNPLKSPLTAAQQGQLEALTNAALGKVSYHEDTIKSALAVGTVKVSANVNQYNVNVTVSAYAILDSTVDDATTTSLGDHTETVRVAAGSSRADVEQAIADSGVEAASLGAWGWAITDPADFERTVSALPETIAGDVDYQITYTPKTLNVSYTFSTSLPSTVPYGYNLTLPVHENTELVYDYVVNGEDYLQASVYRVTGATTITRTEGKAWEVNRINVLVADAYADALSADEIAVLKSAALKGDILRLRTPTNEDDLIGLQLGDGSNYDVSAADYDSGIRAATHGYIWKAVRGRVIDSGASVQDFTVDSGAASFASDDFDNIEVDYELLLDNIDETTRLNSLNIPAKLAREAGTQKANLAILNQDNIYTRLSQLDKATMNRIQFGVNGNMSEESVNAVKAIVEGCFDKSSGTDELVLYTLLTEYRSSGLLFYYQDQNYLKFANQIRILNDNLSIVYNDPQFLPLLIDIDYEEYYGRIGEIIEQLSQYETIPTNELIDVHNAAALPALVAAIDALSGNNPHIFDSAAKEVTLSTTLTKAAPDRAVITLSVQLLNSAGNSLGFATDTAAYRLGTTLTDADIAQLNSRIDALAASLNVDAHYVRSGELGLAAGDAVTRNEIYRFTYSPKTYTAVIQDESGAPVAEKNFTFDVPTIELDACAENGKQYNYTVCGTVIPVGKTAKSVSFTTAQIDDGSYAVISRETIDVNRTELISLVDEMNRNIASAGLLDSGALSASFIPMENASGEISIVFRVSPQNMSKFPKAIQGIAEAITGSDYSYIRLGDSYLRENTLISMQAVIDAVLNSGMSFDTLLGVINESGDIVEMTLPGQVMLSEIDPGDGHPYVSVGSSRIKDVNLLGGKLMQTTLGFGTTSAGDDITVPLYITIEDFDRSASSLKSLRSNVKKLSDRDVSVVLHDGIADISAKLPEKAYQLYVTAMLALSYSDLTDAGNVDLVDLADFVLETADLIVSDQSITLDTFENTAAKAKRSISLDRFDQYYKKLRPMVKNVLDNLTRSNEVTDGKSYSADLNYKIGALLDKVNLKDSLRGIIKEKDSGVNAKVKLTVKNNFDYQAVVVDAKASGLNKLQYTRNLSSTLRRIHDNTVVVLLGDVNGNLTFNNKVVFDLNGHTVNGDLGASSTVYVLDSAIATESGAGVTGTVSGSVKLVAGKYNGDVSAFMIPGFIQTSNGVVRNGYYYVEETNGEIDVRITPEIETVEEFSRQTALAIGMEFAADAALNYYMCDSLAVNGHSAYAFLIDDLVGLLDGPTEAEINAILDCIDCAGITDLANEILDTFTDFAALAAAIKNGQPIASYTLDYAPWSVEVEHISSGDYLTVNVAPDASKSASDTINIYCDDVYGISNTLTKMGEVLTVNTDVELSDISYASGTVKATGKVSADVIADLSQDPNYAIALGVMLASSTSKSGTRTQIIDGIKAYYEDGVMSDLKEAFDLCTTKDFENAISNASTFGSMLSSLGLASTVGAQAANLYDSYVNVFKVLRVILRNLNVEGSATKLGAFETDNYGEYYADGSNRTFEKSVKVAGNYSVGAKLTVEKVSIKVKIFNEDGIVDYKVIVRNASGTEIYKGDDLGAALAAVTEDGSTVSIYDAVTLDSDATVNNVITINDAQRITFNAKILIGSENATITSDASIAANVGSALDDSYVTETDNGDGTYTLALKKYDVVARDNTGAVVYKGSDLNQAFNDVPDGGSIAVNAPVTLGDDVNLDKKVTVTGTDKIDFAGNKIILADDNASLTSDSDLSGVVDSGSQYSEVDATDNGDGTYTYKLKAIDPAINIPTVAPSARVKGVSIDEDAKLIILDILDPASIDDFRLAGNGITAAQFAEMVDFTADNAATTTAVLKIDGAPASSDALVPTGATVTITATNPDSNLTASVTYTVVILGDTNCNGLVDAGDAVLMMYHWYGTRLLAGYALEAADVNRNGDIDVGDAVKNTVKFNRPADYKTDLV